MPTTISFTSQHTPTPLARPSFLLKDSPDPARTGGLYRGLTAPALTNVRDYVPPHPVPSWTGWGPLRSVPRAQMGLGTRPRKRGRWAHRRTQAHNLLLHPLAPRQTEILPSVYSLPCPNLPTSTTTSPAPEESNSQPLSQQDRSQSLWKEWPGAVLLPYHVDRDPELQQPLQNAHPPVPGHHILLSFVIQKPPACQGPWGAHAPSP